MIKKKNVKVNKDEHSTKANEYFKEQNAILKKLLKELERQNELPRKKNR